MRKHPAVRTAPSPGASAATAVFRTISKDAPAGLVVFLVALPLGPGIPLASGAPWLAGVVTGIVGGVIVSWLSGSPLRVSGPVLRKVS